MVQLNDIEQMTYMCHLKAPVFTHNIHKLNTHNEFVTFTMNLYNTKF